MFENVTHCKKGFTTLKKEIIAWSFKHLKTRFCVLFFLLHHFHEQSFKSDTVLTLYYFVSRIWNLCKQMFIHWEKRFERVNIYFEKRVHCKLTPLNCIYSELSLQHFSEIWPQGGKFTSHVVIDSLLAWIHFENLKFWHSEKEVPPPCSWRRDNFSLNQLVSLCWLTVQSHVPLTGQCGIDSARSMTRRASSDEGRAPWVTNNVGRDVSHIGRLAQAASIDISIVYIVYLLYISIDISIFQNKYSPSQMFAEGLQGLKTGKQNNTLPEQC